MEPRERLLAIGVAVLAGFLLLRALFGQMTDGFETREKRQTALQTQIDEKQRKINAGDRANRRIAEWNRRSLPSDRQLASSRYQSWLLGLVERVKLGSAHVHPTSTVNRGKAYESLSFQITGESDLSAKQLVQLMYEFYSANHLQKIKQLTINPEAKKLNVTIDIEALLLPGADRRDKLNQEKSNQLELGDLAAYEKIIGGRNLFAEYSPPAPPSDRTVRPPRPPSFDVAKQTKVTAFVGQDNEQQIWILVQTTGEKFMLKEGEEFTVGEQKWKVLKIGVREAVLTVEGKRKEVHLGDNLHDAVELPAGEL